MSALMYVCGFGACGWGIFAASNTASDIQLGIATTGIVGGAILIGLGRVLSILERAANNA
jgi:hypothetical protein